MTVSGRTVIFALGVLLATLSLAQFVPAIVDLHHDAQSAHAFFTSGVFGFFLGGLMVILGRSNEKRLTPRGAIILTGGSWFMLSIASALPLVFSGIGLSWTDALFEATSGITTTGATVMTGLQTQPAGILLWRGILQWIGGIGIIVTAMAIFPFLGIGGMQLFRMESSDQSDKALPKAGQIAASVALVYLGLSILCMFSYSVAGMKPLDAVIHGMTTVATGGFSTHDGSIGAFAEQGADIIALIFMIAAGLPFLLYLRALQGRPLDLFKDSQARAFCLIAFGACAFMSLWLSTQDILPEPGSAWRVASVNVVSVLTGTGFASADFATWGGGAAAFFFLLMFVGGCAGSTTCSVKIFRYQIAASALRAYIEQYARPNSVRPVRYRGKALPQQTVRSVLGFLFAFIATFAVSACLLAAMGLDTVTAISGAATTLANVGPGLGPIIGPASTFQDLPDMAKWVMILNMLIGRLEVFTVLVLLSPHFWTR